MSFLETIWSFFVAIGVLGMLIKLSGASSYQPPPSVAPTPRTPLPAWMKRAVRLRAGDKCQMCGVSAEAPGVIMHIDHIVPLAKGGKNELDNLQLLCGKCNLKKGAKNTGYRDFTWGQ
jgi:5-methylcytosine-specific restriction endonuclease McrA